MWCAAFEKMSFNLEMNGGPGSGFVALWIYGGWSYPKNFSKGLLAFTPFQRFQIEITGCTRNVRAACATLTWLTSPIRLRVNRCVGLHDPFIRWGNNTEVQAYWRVDALVTFQKSLVGTRPCKPCISVDEARTLFFLRAESYYSVKSYFDASYSLSRLTRCTSYPPKKT